MNKSAVVKLLKAKKLEYEAIKEMMPKNIKEYMDKCEENAIQLVKEVAIQIINETFFDTNAKSDTSNEACNKVKKVVID